MISFYFELYFQNRTFKTILSLLICISKNNEVSAKTVFYRNFFIIISLRPSPPSLHKSKCKLT